MKFQVIRTNRSRDIDVGKNTEMVPAGVYKMAIRFLMPPELIVPPPPRVKLVW